MENKLVSLDVSYSEFLDCINMRDDTHKATLTYAAAIDLNKKGVGKSTVIYLLFLVLVLWSVASVLVASLYSSWFLLLFLAIPVHFIITRSVILKAVWKELTGNGKLPYETREDLYYSLIKKNQLWAKTWDKRPE